MNDAYRAVNRLLAQGARVSAAPDGFYVAASTGTGEQLQKIATDLGVGAVGVEPPARAALVLQAPRIGLWDQYGGSIESGWTRWILEQFEFPFERVFAPRLDAGNLKAAYDVLIFPSGGIPAATGGGRGARGGGRGAGPEPADIPEPYRLHVGRVSADRTIPQIRQFIAAGGTAIAIGDAAMHLAVALNLPVEDHLTRTARRCRGASISCPDRSSREV